MIGVSAAEMATNLQKIKLWVTVQCQCQEQQVLLKLVNQLIGFNSNVLEFIQRMDAKVVKLGFATDAGQDLIRADIHNLPFLEGAERDRALDRLHRALVSKPPDESGPKTKGRVVVYSDRQAIDPPMPKGLA
jgi:hypothetical protein